jgi:hypothetical protein
VRKHTNSNIVNLKLWKNLAACNRILQLLDGKTRSTKDAYEFFNPIFFEDSAPRKRKLLNRKTGSRQSNTHNKK